MTLFIYIKVCLFLQILKQLAKSCKIDHYLQTLMYTNIWTVDRIITARRKCEGKIRYQHKYGHVKNEEPAVKYAYLTFEKNYTWNHIKYTVKLQKVTPS